jgi:hypothetical protein
MKEKAEDHEQEQEQEHEQEQEQEQEQGDNMAGPNQLAACPRQAGHN